MQTGSHCKHFCLYFCMEMASTPLFESPICGNWCGMLVFCTIWAEIFLFEQPFPSQPMWFLIITGIVVKTSPSQNFWFDPIGAQIIKPCLSPKTPRCPRSSPIFFFKNYNQCHNTPCLGCTVGHNWCKHGGTGLPLMWALLAMSKCLVACWLLCARP